MQNEYRTTNDPLPTGTTVAPQPPQTVIADWAKPFYNTQQPTTTANSTQPYLTESDKAFANSGYQQQANTYVPTEQEAYQNQLAMRQKEIDAANATYANLLSKTRLENANRAGTASVAAGRSGLSGSAAGQAIDINTNVFNQDQVLGVEAQRQAAIAAITGQAKADAAKEIELKMAAKKAGYDAVQANIAGKTARAQAAITGLAETMVANGTVLDDKTAQELADTYGVDKNLIKSAYTTAKQESDKAKLAADKTQSEIDMTKSNIAKNNMFDLSEGQAQYYRDPVTGEVKQLAKVAKTYAPKSTGTGGSTYSNEQYKTDLDAIIGGVVTTITSKNGKDAFRGEISKARNDADKINLVAKQVLKDQPADTRKDFSQKAAAIGQIDKAISAIDAGAKTGFINNAKQYTFNVFGKDYDPNLATIGAYITSAVQPYRNSITGAAWGSQEDDEYASLFGSTKYSPKELKQRLQRVKEIMKDTSISQLNSYVNPLDTYENVFVPGQQQATPVGQTSSGIKYKIVQ